MKQRSFLIVIFLTLSLTSSCAKRQQVKQSFTFKVSALSTITPLQGGSYVRAISPTANNLVQLDASNSADFPFGVWEFQTVSFEGPIPFAGKKYCGSVKDININGTPQDVNLNISEANCLTEPFLSLIADVNSQFGSKVFAVNAVQFINHQLVITGAQLDKVTAVNITGVSFNENFTIESKSPTQIIANSLKLISFDVSKIFGLILSDAQASASFNIDFSLCNAMLNGKGFDCAITANDKDVLSYDAASGKWKPRSLNGLNYIGIWNPTSGLPSSGGNPSVGDYYVISVGFSVYQVGDWIVDNGTSFDRIPNSNAMTSVFGRTGIVTANKGDYTLTKMSDVDLISTAPISNQFLKYNGTNWIPSNISYTESDPLVSAFAKTALPTCGAGQVLKSDGTTLSCVTDSTGPAAYLGTSNRAVITDGATGALATSSVTNVELAYLSGVSSAVQTQFNSKQNTLGFTPINKAGDSITSGTFALSGTAALTVQNPIGVLDAANKQYVDGFGQWTQAGGNIYRASGNIGIGTSTPLSLLDIAQNSEAIIKIRDTTSTQSSGTPPFNSSGVESSAGNGTVIMNMSSRYDLNYTGGSIGTMTPHSLGIKTNGVDRISIDSNGKVGIGTPPNPNYKLEVLGDIRVGLGAATVGNGGGGQSTNTALGGNALISNTTGTNNTAIGYYALLPNTTGNTNTANGAGALQSNSTGSGNTAFGTNALQGNTSSNNNTAVGVTALQSIQASSSNNIGLGYAAGSAITTGSNNVIIGSNSGSLLAGASNNIIIADGAGTARIRVDSSGNVALGGSPNTTYKLEVTGDVNATGVLKAAGVTLTSDRRYKRKIFPIENSLEKLEQITGVSFDWAVSDFPENSFPHKKQIGVIAQDVRAVFPELVLEDKKGFLSVNYAGLIGPVINALKENHHQWLNDSQDLHQELEIMNHRYDALKNENDKLKNYLCARDSEAPFCK